MTDDEARAVMWLAADRRLPAALHVSPSSGQPEVVITYAPGVTLEVSDLLVACAFFRAWDGK